MAYKRKHGRGNRVIKKKEIARAAALKDLGVTTKEISMRTGMAPQTIKKYLERSEVLNDPEVIAMVNAIKASEICDLALLGAKARSNLHTQLDAGKMRPIENTAVMDRSFQQRRLLEGESTSNVSVKTTILNLTDKLAKATDALKALGVDVG